LAAFQAGNEHAVRCLLDLEHAGSEATNRFSAKGFFALLRTAIETQTGIFDRLWQLPAAADLTGEDLTVLLRNAIKCDECSVVHTVLRQLQKHKAWGDVHEREGVLELLHLSVRQGMDCQVFCASPYAAEIDAEKMWQLLQESVGVRNSRHRNLQALLRLPAAAQLSSQQILHLMTSATSIARSSSLTSYHPEMPAAASSTAPVEPGVTGELCPQMQGLDCSSSAAGVQTTGNCLSVLCHWKGAAAIGAAGLLRLLQAARSTAQYESATGRTTWAADKAVMLQLCSSKAAASISSAEQLQPLLQTALSCRDAASVKALLQCPAAAGITPAMFSDLMQSINAWWPLTWSNNTTGSAAAAVIHAAAIKSFAQQHVGISTEQLVSLLKAAVEKGDNAAIAASCSHPAASEISSSAIQDLLVTAAALCSSPPEDEVASGVTAFFSQSPGGDQRRQVKQWFVPDFAQLQKAGSAAGSAAPIKGKTSFFFT
jgi:hypothetical protein